MKLGVLVGWKQIGGYLGDVGARTIKTWHQKRPMPIRLSPTGAPMISVKDVEQWVENRPKLSRLKG